MAKCEVKMLDGKSEVIKEMVERDAFSNDPDWVMYTAGRTGATRVQIFAVANSRVVSISRVEG